MTDFDIRDRRTFKRIEPLFNRTRSKQHFGPGDVDIVVEKDSKDMIYVVNHPLKRVTLLSSDSSEIPVDTSWYSRKCNTCYLSN